MYKQCLSFCLLLMLHIPALSQDNEEYRKLQYTFNLPLPSGQYGVGRQWLLINDSSRGDRAIPIFVYYPAGKTNGSNFVLPTAAWRKQYLAVLERRLGTETAKTFVFRKAYGGENAAFTLTGKFPLLIFAPGMNWSSLEYIFIIQELVSAGYIVVGINSSPASPVIQSPAGNFITAPKPGDMYQLVADDMTAVLRSIRSKKGQLHKAFDHADLKQAALLGHSLGGAAALLAAANDPSVIAAVNMDGDVLQASAAALPSCSVLFFNQLPAQMIGKPFSQMKSDPDVGWRYGQMAKTVSRSGKAKWISIEGMYHSNFQDYAMMDRTRIPEDLVRNRLGPVNGTSCLQLIAKTLIAFFNESCLQKNANWELIRKENKGWRLIDLKKE